MKKVLFAVLFAAACGGTQKQSANRSAALAECTYSMPDTSSEEQIQEVIDNAESGALDVCGDQLSADVRSAGFHAVLEQIDPDRANAAVLIRFAIYGGRAPNTP
ncbi:MAG: hypothetical protein ABR567_17720 [Myxococcales bacterium]|nr:hypothetical protein [Myxococcales bacterium]